MMTLTLIQVKIKYFKFDFFFTEDPFIHFVGGGCQNCDIEKIEIVSEEKKIVLKYDKIVLILPLP